MLRNEETKKEKKEAKKEGGKERILILLKTNGHSRLGVQSTCLVCRNPWFNTQYTHQVWWHSPVVPTHGRWRRKIKNSRSSSAIYKI